MTADALADAIVQYVDAAITEAEFRKDEGRGWIKPYPPKAKREAEAALGKALADYLLATARADYR